MKTNLLFFTKGSKTEKICYYDLSQVKVGKKTPLTLAHFGFGKDGSVLGDTELPINLVADSKEDEVNECTPFPSYSSILPKRDVLKGDSRYSWTIDFADRRKNAREEIQPLLDEAAEIKADVVDLKGRLKQLKKEKAERQFLHDLDEQIREKEKVAKDLETKAAAIDAAVFDLKAVNPNFFTKVDERTP